MIYGYCRCSTNESKQDVYRQVRELKKLGVDEQNIYTEYGSGTKSDRKELNRLLDTVVPGDTVITTEVSRISRSTKHLCELIDFAKEHHICFIFGSFTVDCTKELDSITEGMLKMMAVFSELERNMISDRVKSGMMNAQAKGKVVGRPKTDKDNLPDNFYKYYAKYINGEINKTELAKLCELSYPSVLRYIKIIQST